MVPTPSPASGRRVFRMRAASAALAVLVLASCGGGQDDGRSGNSVPDTTTAPAGILPGGFAFDLFHAVAAEPGNLTVSPRSVAAALGMLAVGAAEATRDELETVLRHEAGDSWPAPFPDAAEEEAPYRLVSANRVWVDNGFPVVDAYADALSESFGADTRTLDFRSQPDASRAAVNTWVTERTQGLIRNLVPPGSVDPLTRLVVTNAVYFKGLWETPFDPEATADRPFHLDAATAEDVPTMVATLSCRYLQIEGAQVVELAYRGGDVAMTLIVPDSVGGLGSLVDTLDAGPWAAWTDALTERRVRLHLPRFTAEADLSLGGTLQTLGVKRAFDPRLADFSGITGDDNDLAVTGVFHKAYVKVDEEGTEAAAATGGVMTVTSAPPTVVVDRPFLFAIRLVATGEILFLGRVVDPRG